MKDTYVYKSTSQPTNQLLYSITYIKADNLIEITIIIILLFLYLINDVNQ